MSGIEKVDTHPMPNDNEILTFGIIGLGYVGLPLAVQAATSGKIRVIGFDISEQVIAAVNDGHSHIQDLDDKEVAELRNSGLMEATSQLSRLNECDVISICVPTPLLKSGDPDLSHIRVASKAVAAALHPGQLIILESTTYPGTTREVLQPILESSGLTAGEDFDLCFSPERVDPGNQTWMIKNTPKVIGGLTGACGAAGQRFYKRFVDEVVQVSSLETAELTKILENTFRAVNIGLINEIALIADQLGVDIWEVINAAATKPFGFMKFTPGPGLGGHCIRVDPHYLSWKMRTMDYKTRFIDLSFEINEAMPMFIVDKARDVLGQKHQTLKESVVLVLGVAYKKDINDVRESPALDVMRLLKEEGSEVRYHDPYVPKLSEEGIVLMSEELTDSLLRLADVVLILTDHSCFDYLQIADHAQAIVDARNALANAGVVTPGRDSWIVKS